MLIPVRVFDDHLDVWIDGSGRPQHEVLRDLAHRIETILRPAPRAFGRDVGVAFAGIEEEIVEDHFVEVFGGEFRGLFAFLAVGGIFVIEGAELPALAAGGERHAARNDDALGLEFLLDGLDLRVGGKQVVAIDFDVDLIEFELAADAVVFLLEDFGIGKLLGGVDHHIDRGAEILVFAMFGSRLPGRSCDEQRHEKHRADRYAAKANHRPSFRITISPATAHRFGAGRDRFDRHLACRFRALTCGFAFRCGFAFTCGLTLARALEVSRAGQLA